MNLRLLVFAVLPALSSTVVVAQTTVPSDSARKAMIARAMERMRAGPEHRPLQALTGEWVHEARYADASRADLVMTGTARVRQAVEGRFIVIEGRTQSPEMSVDAMTVLGYDRRFNRYTYVGFDSFGTYYVTAAGSADSTGSIVMGGEDRQVNGAVKRFEFVLKVASENRFVIETWFFDDAGRKHRAVTATYTRKG